MNPKNPYYVLELPPAATPGEIERQGRKLLGLIELGSARGTTYVCPLGVQQRDATMVRDAMASLRDPRQRAKQRCLASLLATSVNAEKDLDTEAEPEQLDDPLPDALHIVYPGL